MLSGPQGHDTLSRLRREEYDKFLKATNGKQGLFLDIVLENDYDPFVPNARRIKSDCGKIHDPVKRVLSKAEEEKGMVDRSKFAKAKKPGRETLDVKQWHTGKIEATPHGHFAMMMAEHAGGTTEKAAKVCGGLNALLLLLLLLLLCVTTHPLACVVACDSSPSLQSHSIILTLLWAMMSFDRSFPEANDHSPPFEAWLLQARSRRVCLRSMPSQRTCMK